MNSKPFRFVVLCKEGAYQVVKVVLRITTHLVINGPKSGMQPTFQIVV
jgi:hypothetical protein